RALADADGERRAGVKGIAAAGNPDIKVPGVVPGIHDDGLVAGAGCHRDADDAPRLRGRERLRDLRGAEHARAEHRRREHAWTEHRGRKYTRTEHRRREHARTEHRWR